MSASGPLLGTLLRRLQVAVRSVAVFVTILLAVYLPGRFVIVPLLKRVERAVEVDQRLWNPFVKIINGGFAVLALYLALPLSGLVTTPSAVAAMSAGVTIALGFAARDALGNFVSGVFIVTDPKLNIGDWVVWNDREGIIEDISFRVTRVHTFDNELITIPNTELTTNAVVNPVAKDELRINYDFTVGYGEDLDEVQRIIVEEADAHPEILDRPRASVVVDELAESHVVLTARFWIANPTRTDFQRIRSEYVQAVKRRFDEEGIEIPYPYRQLTGTVGTRTVSAEEA